MSYGCDSNGIFGFSDVKDWLESVILSFPAPWSIAPLDGKYYGTVIRDGDGRNILSVWEAEGEPSHRQKAWFCNWTPEAWAEYCCDTHWESAICLQLAENICRLRNAENDELFELVQWHCRWEEDIWPMISCGGPDKRRLGPSDSSLRSALGYK